MCVVTLLRKREVSHRLTKMFVLSANLMKPPAAILKVAVIKKKKKERERTPGANR